MPSRRTPKLAEWTLASLVVMHLGSCASMDRSVPARRLAVLSAFPGELAPLLERASIQSTVTIEDRRFRIGTLGGAPVVLGLTGIGMVNAERTTRALLEQLDISGIVVSGVAGTVHRVGDVDVPSAWSLKSGPGSWPAHPPWLDLARELAGADAPLLESCTTVPGPEGEERVCLGHQPAVRVGGVGKSGDEFGGKALPCDPTGDEVTACDVGSEGAPLHRPPFDPRVMAPVATEWDATVDMETAAIAREASRQGLPYIAFRAGSDGSGDPLELPGFPAQFFAYYRLAAQNAAAATIAFLERFAPG